MITTDIINFNINITNICNRWITEKVRGTLVGQVRLNLKKYRRNKDSVRRKEIMLTNCIHPQALTKPPDMLPLAEAHMKVTRSITCIGNCGNDDDDDDEEDGDGDEGDDFIIGTWLRFSEDFISKSTLNFIFRC